MSRRRKARKSRLSFSRSGALFLTGTVVASGIAFAHIASNILERPNPALAKSFWAGNDEAWARAAAIELVASQPNNQPVESLDDALNQVGDLSQGELFARRSLQASPTQVSALRTLSYIELLKGEGEQARMLAERASNTSRRDTAAQLLLARADLIEGDVPSALAAIDRSLRVTRDARGQIFGVLIQALESPEFVSAFQPYVSEQNEWLAEFLVYALQSDAEPALVGTIILDAQGIPELPGRQVRELAPLFLVPKSEILLARNIAMALPSGKRPAANGMVSDGQFDQPEIVEPFGWVWADQSDIQVRRPTSTRPDLTIASTMSFSGELARQLLVLQPGSYQFKHTGDLGNNLHWSLTCTPGGQTLLTDQRTPNAQFVVPDGECEGQWLRLNASALGPVNAVIESVSIMPR